MYLFYNYFCVLQFWLKRTSLVFIIFFKNYIPPRIYTYADFGDVLNWIRHFTDVYGPQLVVAFDQYIRLREYYERGRIWKLLVSWNVCLRTMFG